MTTFAGAVLLTSIAIAAAALMRAVRCPGAAIVGGVAAGLLMGPGVLGRTAPQAYERLFVGGAEAREALDELRRLQAIDEAAAARTDAEPAPEDVRSREQAITDAEDALRAARWREQGPLRWACMIVVAVALLLGIETLPAAAARASAASVMSIGAWAAAFPGALVFVVLYGLLEVHEGPALLVASTAAVGPYVLTTADLVAAEMAEVGGARLIRAAGRLASLFAAAAFAVGLHWMDVSAAWAAVLLALPAAWIIDASAPRALAAGAGRLREWLAVPALAALAAVKIDLLADIALWPALLLMLVSGDGRWIGATIGAVIPGGRRWLRSMRLVMGSMACGPTQLALAAIAAHAWALDPPLVAAILCGAVVVEIAAPARRAVATRLTDLEDDLR